MTQTNPQANQQDPAKEEEKRGTRLWRCMVVGDGVLYERKRLWPQGPTETEVAKYSMAVDVLNVTIAATEKMLTDLPAGSKQRSDAVTQLAKAKEELRDFELKHREAINENKRAGGMVPIEALVGEMLLIDEQTEYEYDDEGAISSTTKSIAVVEILGEPFGQFRTKGIFPTATIPQVHARWENLWHQAAFEEHVADLTEDDDEEDDEDGDGEAPESTPTLGTASP